MTPSQLLRKLRLLRNTRTETKLYPRLALRLGGFLGVLLSLLPCERALAEPVVLASAQLGAIGKFGGTSVTVAQFVGWRFQTDVPLAVEQVGAHALEFDPGGLFAAIVRLDSIAAVPSGAPFTPDEVLATTVFQAPLPSAEVFAPLSANLNPGSYVLVFGTGLFGATGAGALPNLDDQPDIPPTDLSSFIFWSIPSQGQPMQWRLNLASHMRVVINANALVPGDVNFDGAVNIFDVNLVSSHWDETGPTGDANGDHAVNIFDVNLIASNWTETSDFAAVPEPTTAILAVIGATIGVGIIRRRHRVRSHRLIYMRDDLRLDCIRRRSHIRPCKVPNALDRLA